MKQILSLSKLVGIIMLFSGQLTAQIGLSFPDQTVESEAIFKAELTVADFNDVASMQGTFSWDPAVIEYVGIEDFILPTTGVIAHFGTNNTASGVLTLVWFNPDFSGVTYDDGTVIFSIEFKAISTEQTVSTNIDLIETPTPLEISNEAGNVLTAQYTPGVITVVPMTNSVNGNEWTYTPATYPNPTQGDFLIDLGRQESLIHTNLMDISGRVISRATYSNISMIEMDIEGPAGIYFLELTNSQNQRTRLKVVKE